MSLKRFPRTLDIIDSHTCGQPTRLIVGGAGIPPGTPPLAAREELREQRDWVRRLAVLEPRGHRSMFAVALIEPGGEGAPFGLVYLDASGYPDMCGHATIGAATTLFETGRLSPPDPSFSGDFEFQLAGPMGMLDLRAAFDRGRCVAVAFRTPLAYFLGSIDLRLPGGDSCPVDIAYGGQWYAFAPVTVADAPIAASQIDHLIGRAAGLRKLLAEQLDLRDPRTGAIPSVTNIVWTSPPDGDEAMARNVPISGAGSFDRSPCGTATCARMAALAAKGQLEIGGPFVNQGLLGTLYRGRLIGPAAGNGVEGFIPEVEGNAWLTGQGQIWADPSDPLGDGFLV